MANDCYFRMRILGEKENVKTFFNWLSADYDYTDSNNYKCYLENKDGSKTQCEHHIGYRVFSATYENEYKVDADKVLFEVYGDCAWSVWSCMFNGAGTYMDDHKDENEKRFAISIVQASKMLGLEIEVFSEECGMCFSEHYYIKNGDILIEGSTYCSYVELNTLDSTNEAFCEDEYKMLSAKEKEIVAEFIADGEENMILCGNIDYDTYELSGYYEYVWEIVA